MNPPPPPPLPPPLIFSSHATPPLFCIFLCAGALDFPVDYFGAQLAAQGYSYYGSEPLYSGLAGTEMHADIFIGIVYYQRLRHMVRKEAP